VVWNSFAMVRNITNLIVGRLRRLLGVIIGCRPCRLSDKIYLPSVPVHIYTVARGGAVGWGTALLVLFPMMSLEFYLTLILQAAL